MVSVKNPELSIIILNFNVRELLLNCLESVFKDPSSKKWQVIVVDNASSDSSVEAVKNLRSHIPSGNTIEIIENKENLGFAGGNNAAISKIKAPVVLFLNPDTVVVDNAISKTFEFFISNPDIGAATCRVELPSGKLDYSCHRGFPTPWNSLSYFLGLAKFFPGTPIFAGYTATYLDINKTHEIDCLTGAFLMVRRIAGEQIGWWDQDYFWNGEDIEFCYSLKEKGWKIFFFAGAKIIHYKGSSAKATKDKKLISTGHGISAMRIFYRKHYYKKYPPILRDFIFLGVKTLEHYRKLKIVMS